MMDVSSSLTAVLAFYKVPGNDLCMAVVFRAWFLFPPCFGSPWYILVQHLPYCTVIFYFSIRITLVFSLTYVTVQGSFLRETLEL